MKSRHKLQVALLFVIMLLGIVAMREGYPKTIYLVLKNNISPEVPKPVNVDNSYCISAADTVENIEHGYRWVKVTCHAPFAPRDGAGAIVYKGSMWLIGGWNPKDKINFPRVCNNEVWKSSNGNEWDLVKLNSFIDKKFDKSKDWEGRHTAGYVVFKDKMWIVGGDPIQGHYQNDVWNSSNGKDWDLVTASVPWGPRALHYTVVFDGKIWVMGGQTMPQFADAKETFYSDIWNSEDGVNWNKVETSNDRWLPRGMIGGSAVFKDRIWIIGGANYDTPNRAYRTLYNDVWSSKDGVTWKCHTQSAEWLPRNYHDVAVWDNKLWLLEGSFAGQIKDRKNLNEVWFSEDGETWTELPDTPWTPRHASSVFVHNDGIFVATGNNMESDVWRLEKM